MRHFLPILLLFSACAQVSPPEEFAFQTEAEKLAADVQLAADVDADTADVAELDTDADAADTDVADTAVDARDADADTTETDADTAETDADTAEIDAAETDADTAEIDADTAETDVDAGGSDGDAAQTDVAAEIVDADAAGSDAESDGETAGDADATGDADSENDAEILNGDVTDTDAGGDPCATLKCDDGNDCTSDSCVSGACSFESLTGDVCGADKCSGNGSCASGECKFSSPISCDDGNVCTQDGCDPASGCTHVGLNGGNCSGDKCFTAQTCLAGQCQGGSATACDDGKICTTDSCDPATGCVFAFNTASCDDGDACMGADVCAGGACKGISKFFDKVYGGASNEFLYDIVTSTDGFYLAGSTASSGNGGDDGWLIRTDSSGKTLWERTDGGSQGDRWSGMVGLGAGGVALIGETGSKGAGSTDTWLMRVDTGGNLLWEQTFGGGSSDGGTCITTDSTGLAAGGYLFDGSGSFGWLGHVSLAGDATWTVTLSGGDRVRGLATSATGYVVTGGSPDGVWLARTDGSGNLLGNSYFGNSTDIGRSVLSLPDGYLIAGETTSKGAGKADAWLIRTDLNGLKLWDKTYGGKQYDTATRVVSVGSGFAFSGSTASVGSGSDEFWLVRVDSLGNKQFGFPFGGLQSDFTASLAVLPDGFALAGWTGSKGAGGSDGWLLRTDSFGSTSCANSGVCIGKTTADCDDGTFCTADLCDSAHSGCWHNAIDGFLCDDGLICTSNDVCTSAICKGTTINCEDNNSCTSDSCDPEFGCVNEAISGSCNLGLCVPSATCSGGKCSGKPKECDDNNACTADSCDPNTGNCGHTTLTSTCDDNNACTINDNCGGGSCAGTVDSCDDQNVCTTDSCIAGIGCNHSANNVACDDKDAWTVSDTCAEMSCSGCDPNAISLLIDDAGTKKHVCAPDYPRWGLTALSPQTLTSNGATAGTLTDSKTQLVWQAYVSPQTYTLLEATGYCDGLELGGKTDWRLPTRTELQSLTDYTKVLPALGTVALGAGLAGITWTISPSVGQSNQNWTVDSSNGNVNAQGTSTKALVRCVRTDAPQGTTQNRFVFGYTNSIVSDALTGLVWQASAGGTYFNNWQEASDHCKNLTTAGGAWRIPEISELLSVVKLGSFGPALDKGFFDSAGVDYHFTNTFFATTVDKWAVNLYFSPAAPRNATASGQVRCVRGADVKLCDDGVQCTEDVVLANGSCKHMPSPDGGPCDDDFCFSNKSCSGGECGGGTDKAGCDDGNVCTADSCDPIASECAYTQLSGSACDDGSACTTGEACQSGTCGGGKAIVGDHIVTTATEFNDGFYDAAGNLIVAGSAGTAAYLAKIDSNGGVVWSYTGQTGQFAAVAQTLSGGFIATGETNNTGYGVEVDASGALVWSKTWSSMQPIDEIFARADGSFVGIAQDMTANPRKAIWVLLDASGSISKSVSLGARDDEAGHVSRLFADGTLITVGSASSNPSWWSTIDAAGVVQNTRWIPIPQQYSEFSTCEIADDKSITCVGKSSSAQYTGYVPWGVKIESDGAISWNGLFWTDLPKNGGGTGLLRITDDTFLVAGQASGWPSASGNVAFARVDPTRKTDLVTFPYGTPGNNDRINRLLRAANGTVTALGAKRSGTTTGGLIYRADPWFHTSCTALGGCVSELTNLCSDGKSCSLDTCDGTFGCGHANLTNGTACVSGTSCKAAEICGNGTCTGGGPKDFDVTFGSADTDSGNDIVALYDGFAFAGAKLVGSANDSWIVRTDSSGSKKWEFTYPISGGGDDVGNAIVSVSDGLVVVGQAIVSGGNGWQVRAIKVDSGGTAQWDKNFGGSGVEQGNALAIAADGGYGIAGYQFVSSADLYVVRTDAGGNSVWTNAYGGSGTQMGRGIVALPDGFAIAAQNDAKGAGSDDFWLVRTDLSGAILWDQTYGGSQSDVPHAIVSLSDGYAMAGKTGNSDFYVVRTDLNGVQMWARSYGSVFGEIAYGISALSDGFAIAGYTGMNDGGVPDAWLVRTDSLGNRLWDKSFGTGSGNEYGLGIASLSDGFAVIGTTDSKGAGGQDAWVIRTDSFGNSTCNASGTCDGKSPSGCDDGNACTADSCGSTGCVHGALGENSACGGGTCKLGVCVANDSEPMVSLPAGTFSMGSTTGNSDEMPVHQVTLSAFQLDKHEVTVAQYKACVTAGNCSLPDTTANCNWGVTGREQHPVNCVDWTQATTYCEWAGKKLPTEAQWEYAARSGGQAQTYPWGNAAPTCSLANFNGCAGATAAVCATTAGNSVQGGCDLTGNVWEWCSDWYGSYDGAASVNPKGPVFATKRDYRGASWTRPISYLPATTRANDVPGSRYNDLGFRCAK